jgi:hypothetical protein
VWLVIGVLVVLAVIAMIMGRSRPSAPR